MSAARFVVRTRPKPFVMGLPCVFVIGLLASAIRPRLPVIGADVRQIREPRSGETADAFDAQVHLCMYVCMCGSKAKANAKVRKRLGW